MLVLWVCHVCQGKFETPDGGICSRCEMPACSGHLRKQKVSGQTTFVCSQCLSAQEQQPRE
jgi:hypothetical protein